MTSNNFINECKNRANANRLGKIVIDDFENPITNSDKLQSFSIDSGCFVNGNIIGSVYSKCLKVNFTTNIGNLTNKALQAQIGVKYADSSTEFISMGKYIIERPNNEITANMSQIAAYDDLYTNLDNKYVCNINYKDENKTLSDLYLDVCNQLELIPETTNILNGNIPIFDNPFTNGEKNRTVLQTIAKIACSWVEIDNDTNKIKLCWLSQNEEPDYTFYKNDYVSVDGGEITYGPINCLIIKNSVIDDENATIKDDESIALYGEHSITINEDYILYNAELRQQSINAIWSRVKGLKYVDCKLITYYGKPFLKLGDKIRIYINETEYFDTYVFNHVFTYDGTFASKIESPTLTEQEIKTKQNVSLQEALWNTQIEVNKQKKEIKATVSTINDIENSIPNLMKNVSSSNYVEISDAFEGQPLYFSFYGDMHYAWQGETTYLPFFIYDSYLRIDNGTSFERMKLPYFDLNYTDELYDEFVVENSRAYIIRRLNDNKQPLEEEITEELGNISIPLKNGYNKLFMEDFELNYSLKYNVQNGFTEKFAKKTELKLAEDELHAEVSSKVGKNEAIASINLSTEKDASGSTAQIEASKVNIIGVITAINNDTTTTINGNKITTGSIDAEKLKANSITANQVSSDIITTTNFQAQNINADKITGGTINGTNVNITNLNAANITAGTLNGIPMTNGTNFGLTADGILTALNAVITGKITATSGSFTGSIYSNVGTIGGINLSNSGLSNNNLELTNDGRLVLYPQVGNGAIYRFNNGCRINTTAGISIASNSNDSVSMPSNNGIDIKGCSGSTVYLGCMSNVSGTTERSAVSIENGVLAFRSTGYCSYNGTTVFNSSSKATKKNIRILTNDEKQEVYDLLKNIPLKYYDYKKDYSGNKNNYGFIIEDIENTKLKELLHITQNEFNKDIKMYSHEDLTRLELITIQELIRKIESLEERFNER